MFTWIPIHKEAVRKILEFSEPQQELLDALRDMDERGLTVISLNDKSASGVIPLAEIDPFSFFSSFNRGITDENRKENWQFLKERWKLSADVLEDFSGIPIVNNMKSWFFPYARSRDKNHMDVLWQLFRKSANSPVDQVDAALFQQCIGLKQITTNKLTIGLFWVNPETYLPADRKTKAFVAEKGVAETPVDYDSYRRWLDEVRAQVGTNYAQISLDAHLWATEHGEDDDTDDEEVKAAPARRVWAVAPGSKAHQWDEFYTAGIYAINWEELTDLRAFKDKEEIRKKLKSSQEGDSSKVNDTLACWQFAHVMRPGDVLFAKKGIRKIVGFGVVHGDYDYDTNRESFTHVRSVKWLGSGEWKLPGSQQLPMKTLTNITKYTDLVETLAKLVGLDLNSLENAASVPVKTTAAGGEQVSYFWLNANPKMWSFEDAAVGETQTYTSHNEHGNKRQKYKYFEEVKPGDILVGYVTSPQREIVGICRITKALHDSDEGARIEFEKIERLKKPLLYETLKGIPELQECEPLTLLC